MVTVYPEYVERISSMIRASGIYYEIPWSTIEEKCALFECTCSAYYLPPSVKGLLWSVQTKFDIQIFDWRNN